MVASIASGATTEAVGVGIYMGNACATLRSGEAVCWGGNGSGQAGVDSTERQILTPTPVARTKDAAVTAMGPYALFRSGFHFACGLHRSGQLSCTGQTPPAGGIMGLGARRTRTPAPVAAFRLAPVQ